MADDAATPVGGLRVGSILGFEIRIDLSWFVILFLVFWSLSVAVFPNQLPQLSRGTHLVMGTAGTLLFFASLLIHELSHALVSRSKGIPVAGITLFIFGGMAWATREPDRPEDEILIAGVGPVTSLVLAVLFQLIAWSSTSLGLGTPIETVASYLAFINLALAIFNMIPGFPLDGGRVFRAAVWKATGDKAKATRWAVGGGRAFGLLLIVLGAIQALAGAPLGGLWLVFIGWFLRNLAGASLQQQLLHDLLAGFVAADLMSPQPEVVSSRLSLEDLVQDHFMRLRFGSYPVMDGGDLVGMISLEDVKKMSVEERRSGRVAHAMTPLHECAVIAPSTTVESALQQMNRPRAGGRALVVDQGRLVGIISASDVSGWIHRLRAVEGLVGRTT
ncbi:MAG: site-2 protease family protein [Gemmatimonadota bacterium]|nr:site-2 protease family protein [Gemmatimonadota bacterium]